MENEKKLLEIIDLYTFFDTKRGTVKAVNNVSYTVEEGKTLGVVGESGSGKSVSAMSILRLLDGNGYIAGGQILFNGVDLTKLPLSEMYKIRGNDISVIFQEPMTSLNPVFSIEQQLSEPFIIHQGLSKKEAAEKSVDLLREVKIPNPEIVAKQYPHQLSGGMRQRVMIAMALACRPKLLIADEPTTALDVTIQAQILRLMNDLKRENGTSILFITHDLGVINHQGLSKKEAAEKSVDLLREVKIPNPEIVAKQYPHQLSGGMRQRVMIAMALACRPKLLIADEPTTALDVTIQAQILRLMNDLKRENGTSILFITHDLGVINQMADYVAVMYCGQVVERVPAKMLFDPKTEYSHPYTEGLLVSIPRLDTPTNQRLEAIPGAVPHPLDLPKGCKFAPRCKYATEKCHEAEPPMTHLTEEHHIRCYYPNKEERKQNVK